jgi:hypothetical protein
MVTSCGAYKKFQNSTRQKEPMIVSEVLLIPWHTVSADLFKVNNFKYIAIADYYSKFPFMKKLNNLTSTTVVNVARSTFSLSKVYQKFRFVIMERNSLRANFKT